MAPRTRWIVGLGMLGAAGLYLGLHGTGSAPAQASTAAPKRNAPVAPINTPTFAAAAPAAVPVANAEPEKIPLDLGKGDPSPSVAKWKEPGLPGTFREIVAPDDGENKQEVLTYRIRRLRFALTDAATSCYAGGDGMEEIDLAYDLVVQGGVISVDNLQVLSSTWSDGQGQQCIVDSIKALKSAAPDVPDMRQEQRTSISQHDLYERSRQAG